MTDETRIDLIALIDRRLHRKQTEHAIGALTDLGGAFLTPGPDRRADVVHGTQATAFQPTLQAKIEVGRIDAHHQVGLPLQQALAQLAPQTQQIGQVLEHLDQAHHRQPFAVVPGRHPGPPHGLAAHSHQFHRRVTTE